MTTKADWVFMPHWGHFICGRWCRFHINTYLGNGYIVSSIGEYWPPKPVQQIHARVHDLDWYLDHVTLLGDEWDAAYHKRFGFEQVGSGRTYETMVFEAESETDPEAMCCPWRIANGQDKEFIGANDSVSAYQNHMALCEKWSKEDCYNQEIKRAQQALREELDNV
jgi:hypothetical protein